MRQVISGKTVKYIKKGEKYFRVHTNQYTGGADIKEMTDSVHPSREELDILFATESTFVNEN